MNSFRLVFKIVMGKNILTPPPSKKMFIFNYRAASTLSRKIEKGFQLQFDGWMQNKVTKLEEKHCTLLHATRKHL